MYSTVLKIFFLIQICGCQNLKLEQVLILSRHNVRTPLSRDLNEFTPKPWPEWKEQSGYLTAKGELLEGFMGKFFAMWLIQEGVLNSSCPNEKSFYAYANTAQRTIASANAFISNAFPLCNITLNHSGGSKDPIFNPVIHNTSMTFKVEAVRQMQSVLNSLHLNTSKVFLERILDYERSKNCLINHKCSLVNEDNKISVTAGSKPTVEGPLKISKSVIDSFIMENYEGFPVDKVAWGELGNTEQWNMMMELSGGYHEVKFNTTVVANDLAKPLLTFIKNLLIYRQYKVILLMGHDANIYTVLKSLQTKPYMLKHQYEKVPAGGKILFQKWTDQSLRESFVKIDYIYQSTEQMRKGKGLSIANPPEFTLLELKGCPIGKNGLCHWKDFVKLLNTAIRKV